MITWLQYYKLKPIHNTASLFWMRKWLLHCACLCVKETQPKLLKVAPSKWDDFEQREILWLEKLIQISPSRTVTICDRHKSNSGFCTSLDTLAEINFRLKLFLKTSHFFVWKLLFRQKKKVEGRRKISKIWGVGSKNLQWLS